MKGPVADAGGCLAVAAWPRAGRVMCRVRDSGVAAPSLRTVREGCPSLRLKQTVTLRASRGPVAHGSLCRLGVRLQARRVASNLSLRPGTTHPAVVG